MNRFLITTALESSWRNDGPILFLGEWCRRFSRKERWSALDAEVLPYHWNDRAKLYADYQYLLEFHERVLTDLGRDLNRIHGVDHGTRYWRILIGPWLGYFTEMLFDRWCSIQHAIHQFELSETIVLSRQNGALVPNDMGDFSWLYAGDEWNHHIYATILERYSRVKCIKQPLNTDDRLANSGPKMSWKRQARRKLLDWLSRAASILTTDKDAFFLATYLPYRDEMSLHRRFGQIPQLWRSAAPQTAAIDRDRRRWIVAGENRSDFEACARNLIPLQIPAVYLEGYRQLVAQATSLPWPRRPKVIWTSNSHMYDDVFKAWAAERVECGSPLVIGQHGGHYGIGQWSFPEDHEIAISDYYLSWGWTEPTQPKIKPVGQVTFERPKRVSHAKQKWALLVESNVPRHSVPMYSSAFSTQMLDYFQDQYKFANHLPRKLQSALTVRLYPQDYGWDQASRWQARFPDLHLDDGRSEMKDLIRRCRIYISTYNGSTYLESFSMNVPTVIFWNPNHWELRDSAIPYFDSLKSVGIFHETPESAARQIVAVWDDVDTWWQSPAVQGVLEQFKSRYCYRPVDLLGSVEQVLRDTIASSIGP